MVTFQSIFDELNSLTSLRLNRAIKLEARKTLEVPQLSAEEPEDLASRYYWQECFEENVSQFFD